MENYTQKQEKFSNENENSIIKLNYDNFLYKYKGDIEFFNNFELIENDENNKIVFEKILEKIKEILSSSNENLLLLMYAVKNSLILKNIYYSVLSDINYIILINQIFLKEKTVQIIKGDKTLSYHFNFDTLLQVLEKRYKEEEDVNTKVSLYQLLIIVNKMEKIGKKDLCALNDLDCRIYYLQESVKEGKEEIIKEIKEINKFVSNKNNDISDEENLLAINSVINKENIEDKFELIRKEIENIKELLLLDKNIEENLNDKSSNEDVEESLEFIKEKCINIEENLNIFQEKGESEKNKNENIQEEEFQSQIKVVLEGVETKMNGLDEKIELLTENVNKITEFISAISSDRILNFITAEEEIIKKLDAKLENKQEEN